MVLAAIVVLYLIYVLAALYLAGKIIEKGNQPPAQPQPNTIATPTPGPNIT